MTRVFLAINPKFYNYNFLALRRSVKNVFRFYGRPDRHLTQNEKINQESDVRSDLRVPNKKLNPFS